MAYDHNSLVLVQNSNASSLAKLWTYTSTADNLATVETSGYFVPQSPRTSNDLTTLINIGDSIWLSASDGNALVAVTGVNPIAVSAIRPPTSLTNDNIWIGSAGNAAVGNVLSGDITVTNAGVTAIGAGKVLSSMIAPNFLQYASVSISAAQFLGMYATPISILAAPGAGLMNVVTSAWLVQDFVSASSANGGATQLQYGNTIHGAGAPASESIAAALLNSLGASEFLVFYYYGAITSGSNTLISAASNAGIYLSNKTAAFITGDSTFTLNVYYFTIPSV